MTNPSTNQDTTQSELNHQLSANIKLLQKAIIISDNRALILKRSPSSFSRPNGWDLPGGNAEWPKTAAHDIESPHLDDLLREIKEETNLDVSRAYLRGLAPTHFDTYFEAERGIYSVISIYVIKFDDPLDHSAVVLSEEHQDYAWVSSSELVNYEFGPGLGPALADLVQAALLNAVKQ